MEISSVKDWCIALDQQSANAKLYEDKLYDYYKSIGDTKTYVNSMMTGCYKQKDFKSQIPRAITSKMIAKLIVSAVFGLLCFIGYISNGSGSMGDKIKNGASTGAVIGVVCAITTLIVICGLSVLIAKASYKSKIKTLTKLETNLIPLMQTIPSNYRNSDKMNAIAKIYFTKPTIDPSILLDCADDFINELPVKSRFMSVMFDLPCNCPFLGVSDSQNSNTANIVKIDENGNIEHRNEYLPSDIDSKVIVGSEDADKDLKEMIGLEDVKDQIERLKTRIAFYKNNKNNGNHMVFYGSAGTGKTTVARIITKIMYDLGYIKKNQYIEISGDYLRAGNTSRASAIIEYSYGGVLFIDEAYLMQNSNSADVIGVLLKAMEDHREDFICILAGYEEQMNRLLGSNEGFSSRIKHKIYFSDYDENEMLDIFKYFIKDYNGNSYTVSDEAVPKLLEAFKFEKKAKSFGNARTVRNAVDIIMDFYADRSIKEKTDTHVIMLPDVERYYEDRRKTLQHEIKNASAANQVDEQIIRLSELKPRVKAGSENPDEDFKQLIGLDDLMNEINLLKNQKEFYNQTILQRILLVGESGCGKTTVAKIITGYLYKFGYIEENKYLEIPAEFLKGSFVGHTAKRAEAIISYASGGVLLIKNYSILAQSSDAFASEAVSAVMTAINENPNVTIIIADKPSETIDEIRNLFTMEYDFPTYTEDQLIEIFVSIAAKDNFTVDDAAVNKLREYLKKNKVNVRDIQQIFAGTAKTHIANFDKTSDGTETNKYFISETDITFPVRRIKLNIKPKGVT